MLITDVRTHTGETICDQHSEWSHSEQISPSPETHLHLALNPDGSVV